MIRSCPNCHRRVESKARYCPDCYTVFPSKSHTGAGGGDRSRLRSAEWKFALFLFLAMAGTWFYQLEVDGWGVEEGSFQDAAVEAKRKVIGYAARITRSARGWAAHRREGYPVERADVRQARGGCTIAQTVSNNGPGSVSPVTLTFSFRSPDGAAIGHPVSATVDETLPAGASRDLIFEVACPEMFASVQARTAEAGIEVGASARGASVAEDRAWFLDNDHRLRCAPGAACEVTIRFRSGDSAVYLIERRNHGDTRLFATDQRGTDLLSASASAALVVVAPGGVTAIPIVRGDDDRWSVAAETRLSATGEPAGNNEGL